MTYTRKHTKPLEVTLNLSWVEEPVTVLSQTAAPFTGFTRLSAGDPSELFDWLPDEVGILLETASLGEVTEFFAVWEQASNHAEAEARDEGNIFQQLMRGFTEGHS